jgi:hypothetical protein
MSSTRTELCGIFAAITHLRLVVEYYHIIPNKNVSCRIHCDSKAALARVVDKHYDGFGTTWWCRTHYDLEVAILDCLLKVANPHLLAVGAGACESPETAT